MRGPLPASLVGGVFALVAGGTAARAAASPLPPPVARAARALLESLVPAADDPDAVFSELLQAAGGVAGSAMSAALVDRAADLASALQRLDRAADLLAGVLARDDLHPLARRSATVLRARLLRRLGRTEEAGALDPWRHRASSVLVVGPFGDAGDHYEGVVFGPELEFPPQGRRMRGRFGSIAVRVVRRRPHERTLALAGPGPRSEGCYYALHRVRAETDTAGWVEVECRGSFSVYVNGRRIGGADRRRRVLPTVVRLPVALRAGRNHVLLKTEENGRDRIALSYVDGAGAPLPGVHQVDANEDLGPRPAPARRPPPAAPFVDATAAWCATADRAVGKDATAAALAAAHVARRAGDRAAAMERLHRLERNPPQRGIAALAYARLLEEFDGLPGEVRRARAREVFDAAAPACEHRHWVVLQRARHLADADRPEEAIRLLERRVAAGEAGPETFARLHELLERLGLRARARRLRARWMESCPTDMRPVLAEVRQRIAGADASGALELLSAAADRVRSGVVERLIFELAMELGRRNLVDRALDRLHALDPEAPGALRDRAIAAHRFGRPDEEATLWRKLAAHPRAEPEEVQAAGDALLHLGREKAALAAYRRVLADDGSRQPVRRLLARLEERPEFPMLARFRRRAERELAEFRPSPRERTAPSTLVLDHMIVRILPDGGRIEEVHTIRRINDLAGVERYQDAQDAARADEVLTLRTIGTDGKDYVPLRVGRHYSMPRLEPGALVESEVRRYVPSPAPGPWRAPTFFFQGEDEPFVLSEYVLILPPEAPGNLRVRAFSGTHRVERLPGGHRAHVWTVRNSPRLPVERNHPPLEEIVPVVAWGEDRSLEPAAREALADALRHTRGSPWVAAKAAELTRDLQDQAAKLRAVHAFVHGNVVDGGSARDPTAILLQGKGSRFHLELALLRAAGLHVEHAVSAPAPRGFEGSTHPLYLGETVLDRPAAVVRLPGGRRTWLFADAPRHLPLGAMPPYRAGAEALLLGDDDFRAVRVPPAPDGSGYGVRASLRLSKQGDAEIRAEVRFFGGLGYGVADRVRQLETTVRRAVARQLVGRMLPGWTPRRVEFVDLDRTDRPATARAEAEKRRVVAASGDGWLLAPLLPPSHLLARFGGPARRRTLPFVLRGRMESAWQVLIDPGPEFRVVEMPPPVRVRHALLDYELTYRLVGDRLAVRRVLRQRPGRIPAFAFDEWVRLLRRIDLAEERRIGLRRP